jgi:hypothetical protein
MPSNALLLCVLLCWTLFGSLPQSSSNESPKATPGTPGSEECTRCHGEIAKSYENTGMAAASGSASEAVTPGTFEHKPSNVHYRVYGQGGTVWMSFEREGKDAIRGQRELLYFLGSGRKTRSYLFSDQGFLFQAPINWYSQERRWNMTPGYSEAQGIPMNLPSRQSCLTCHASGLRAPLPGTENKYAGKPFLHAGITCERCHGTGEAHLQGKGPMVNPATLPPERRDFDLHGMPF